MMIKSAKEAKEIINLWAQIDFVEPSHRWREIQQEHKLSMQDLFPLAHQYLAALEGPEVQALVAALERCDTPNHRQLAIEALDQYYLAVNPFFYGSQSGIMASKDEPTI